MRNIKFMNTKGIITFILVIISISGLYSQDKRITFSADCSVFSDLGRTPVFTELYVRQTSGSNLYYKYFSKTNYFSLINISLNCNAKIKELNKHSGLSFNTGLSFGLTGAFDMSNFRNFLNSADFYYLDDGISMFKLNLPMYLSIDYGLNSESQKNKKIGVSFGLGAEVNKVPVVVLNAIIMNEKPKITSFWIQPIGVIKISLLSPVNSLYKICITGGLGKPLDYPITGSGYHKVEDLENNLTQCRAFSLNLSFEIPISFNN